MTTRTRLRRTTTRLDNGTTVTKTKLVEAGPLEWQIQAEAVRRCRMLPGFGDEASDSVTFTLAGDFNASRRSPQQSTIAKATGIVAGEQDLRFYGQGGNMLLVEMKGPKTPISKDQHKRHALHRHLGFRVEVIRGKTIEQGAADVVALVQSWLADCGHSERPPAAETTLRAGQVANDNSRASVGLKMGSQE